MHKLRKQNSFGFSIIELSIIIAVIGILAGISLLIIDDRRDKARGALMWADFQIMEGALESYAKSEGIDEWWTQTELGGTSSAEEVTFQTMIDDPNDNNTFSRYMARPPEPPIELKTAYGYDNDFEYNGDDTFDPRTCPEPNGNAAYKGVNIVADVPNSDDEGIAFFEFMDETYDDGDPDCGRLTIVSFGGSIDATRLFYHIAIDKDDLPASF